jgi:hypothetical protein
VADPKLGREPMIDIESIARAAERARETAPVGRESITAAEILRYAK